MSEIELEFAVVAKEIADKLKQARELIAEADALASTKLHTTLAGADYSAFESLQSIMEDTGFVTEREVSWDSSGCFFG